MSNDPTETTHDEENKTEVNESTINEIDDKNVEEKQGSKENTDTFDFEPFLYPFKISPFLHSSLTTITMLSNDRIHQDNAFGIIWLLFSEKKQCPSIPQLHWSLIFLQNLKNSDGTYTEDVNKCIQIIQSNLIKQYAKIGILLKDIYEIMKDDKSLLAASMPKSNNVQGNKNFDIQPYENASEIMSLTYNEMISRGPLPCIEQVHHNYNALLETSSLDSIKRFIKDLHLPKESIANMSKKELLQFFDNTRKEYVETMKKQVDIIYSLENFMQDIDKNSFKAYITDDLIKHLNEL
ncbi:hypothetical protein KPH14_010454 [Odynerus spinipes]|uniref:Uncharacterized protein n=1 Tax=Odynerus spinipes TaxID=1348599 RepID=A0AAD9VTU5_9HYME|nr:hypothetical protein KPH14_010454 [Odynerus spinipes]